MRFSTLVSGLALGGLVAAHPGHNVQEEALERRSFLQSQKRSSLAHCADKLKARNVHAANAQRRAARLDQARRKRGLENKNNNKRRHDRRDRRDLDSVLGTSHNMSSNGDDDAYSPSTSAETLFAGYHSCLLTPEVTQGPYFVAGEYVREDVREDQAGLDLLLDFQVVDVNTCDVVPNVYVEIWHCNATGVYSGVVANGNGDASDASNLDQTFLRGIQQSNADGVATFESIFPGHYTSRATHIHILVHTNTNNTTLYANSTLGATETTYASHVGQGFFDQDLIAQVEALAPYSTNTQDVTLNADDSILSEEAATDGVDPLFEYTLLGSSLSDGLFAWIAFGINSTLSDSVSPAAYLYESGGVENANSNIGGGGGPGGNGTMGGNGTAPTGAPPS